MNIYGVLRQVHFGTSLFHEPFPAEELHSILRKIKTKKRVLVELERIRQILVELEKPDYRVILLPKDRQQCISKFSQLFRAFLIRRDSLMESNPSESDSESSAASDDSYSELEELIV
jgi:hypothetical protein